MPASLPTKPGGRVASMRLTCWEPSALASLRRKGVNTPAVGSTVPAVKEGVLDAAASLAMQSPPPGPFTNPKESASVTSDASGALQGVRMAGGGEGPQVRGGLNAARGRESTPAD